MCLIVCAEVYLCQNICFCISSEKFLLLFTRYVEYLNKISSEQLLLLLQNVQCI